MTNYKGKETATTEQLAKKKEKHSALYKVISLSAFISIFTFGLFLLYC